MIEAIIPITIKVLKSILILLITYALSKYISKKLDYFAKGRGEKIRNYIVLGKYVSLFSLYLFSLILILEEFNIDLIPIISSLGILSFLVSFTLKDVINNVALGFLISIDPPLSVGDYVNINGIFGKVLEISLRGIKIKTNENAIISIPMKKHFIS